MDPKCWPTRVRSIRLPRASGDGPSAFDRALVRHWAAPRERGWTLGLKIIREVTRGCPARAGMDPSTTTTRPGRRRLPRASGDGPFGHRKLTGSQTAAPRERGWTRRLLDDRRPVSGCPARAGMDPRPTSAIWCAAWLPRASGDGPQAFRLSMTWRPGRGTTSAPACRPASCASARAAASVPWPARRRGCVCGSSGPGSRATC